MTKKKILFVLGTRPEVIKLAPVIKEVKTYSHKVETLICLTGQHKELAEQALTAFEIFPDFDLQLMKKGHTLSKLNALLLDNFDKILSKVEPDMVVVHGDTTTAMSAALATFYKKIPIAHIEAGLRTNNIFSPFPEEFNRQTISKITSLHFAPTAQNAKNLIEEGCDEKTIFVTGNTVIDALQLVENLIQKNSLLKKKLSDKLKQKMNCSVENTQFILITCHRRENFGEPLKNICEAIKELATKFENMHYIFPVHLNPNIKTEVHKTIGNIKNIHLIEPVDYFEFIYLMLNSYFVISDSGGIQEEAPSLRKPLLVTREITERQEVKESGMAKLVGYNKKLIVDSAVELIMDNSVYEAMQNENNPFATQDASTKIVEILVDRI